MVTFSGDVPPLVTHSAHPEHTLKLEATGGALFHCDGCKQIGHERRYRCERCDFDLHICCARPPAGMEHSMFKGRALTFFHRRPAIRRGSIIWCDVCGSEVLGFLYHSPEHNLDIHPPCAILPQRIVEEDDGRELDLHRATGHKCGLCRQDGHRGRYLAYRLLDDDGELVYLHVACLMEANSVKAGEQATPQDASTTGELDTVKNRFYQAAFLVARVSYSETTMDKPDGMVFSTALPYPREFLG